MTFQQALSDRKMINHILNRAGIPFSHPNYEDYFQEALILYVECEQESVQKSAHAPSKSFIYSHIYWRLIDMLRRDWHYETIYQQHNLQELTDELGYEDAHFEFTSLIHELEQRLHPKERRYLELRYLADLPLAEICHLMKISRRTAFRIQTVIHEQARQLRWE